MKAPYISLSAFVLLLSLAIASHAEVTGKSLNAQKQSVTNAILTGRVVDEKGHPLVNVTLQTDRRQYAMTNAEGIFQLTGLTPRKYYIDANANNLPLVTPQFTATITEDAQIKRLPDIVMTPGVLVVGKITNKETGSPIAGAKVSSSGINFESGTIIRLISVRTNADGKYQLRLPSVKTTVFASNTSQKYFEQTLFKSVDLKEGQTVIWNVAFDPGVTLSGTAVDNQGQPIKSVSVIVDAIPIKSDYRLLPRKTVTDSKGNWSISGIAPRQVQVRVGNSWATDKLVTLTLPHPAKVLLHLIPQNDLPPIGRLVDTNGKPVSGIKVTLQYKMPQPSSFDIETTADLITDKNGDLHFRVPLVADSPIISDVDIKGYQWTNGGDWDAKTRRFSDVTLDPLTRKISGSVVDRNEKPVAGARVLVVGLGKGETTTKPDGTFAFADLPNFQQLTLLAIGNAGVAKLSLNNSQKTMELRLSPIQQHFPSHAQSLDALEILYNSDVEQNSTIHDVAPHEMTRSELVSKLAVSDPQEAARVIASSDENTKIFQYQNAVQAAVTAKNSKLALYWFEQFRLFGASLDERSSTYFELQEAAIATINLIGRTDPKQALQIARSIDDANALVLAAQFQPRETALKIWREQYARGGIFNDARLVGLIYDADKSDGKVLFDAMVKSYWAELNTDNMMRRSAGGIAYYLARYKPRESWLMLHTEWKQTQLSFAAERALGHTISPIRASSQADLALAMSAVDFTQAMIWARQIQDKTLSRDTQRHLLEIALATPEQRRKLCLLCFYISDSYKPGDPPTG